MKQKKLYNLLPSGFELTHHVSFDGTVRGHDATNLPLMYSPDGVPCIEANAYMLSLFRRSLSRRHRGGTIAEYAKNISPLIRFCHNQPKPLNLTDLTDNTFTLFIHGLQARDSLGQRQRSSNQVLKIGRSCIDFLRFLIGFHDQPSLIGPKNCSITVVERTITINLNHGKQKKSTVWQHDSFPSPDPFKQRHPISSDVVSRLKAEAQIISERGIRSRTELLLTSFEQTGGRRGEVSNIKVKDIEDASNQKGSAPMLKILTLKQKTAGETYRTIPVPRTFIQQAAKYIQRHRRRVIRNTIGISNDHGYMLISHTTGKKLSEDTLTTQLSRLCTSAGISDQPGHPHLFRHAYITQKLKAIILQHDVANKDEFRKALLNTEAFKQQLQQWTGHSQLSSLDTYIDLAFSELSHMDKVYSAVNLGAAVEVALDRLESLKQDAKTGDTIVAELLNEFEELIGVFQEDIKGAIKNE